MVSSPDPTRTHLSHRAPLAWHAAAAHLASRATPGVEAVADVAGTPWYWRTVALDGCAGVVGIGPATSEALDVCLTDSLAPVRATVLARLRRLFDLDMDVPTVEEALSRDALLAPLVARRPGLRVIGAFDGFELAVRAILGQQVSVRGATTLAGRLVAALGERLPPSTSPGGPPLTHLALDAARVADAGAAAVAAIGLPRARAECIVGLARAVADGTLPELVGDGVHGDATGGDAHGDARTFAERFVALPGIGPWTASYVAMRALRDADAFPEGDLALRKAAGGVTVPALRARAEAWRPWRAYAAQHLWASLG